MVPIQKSLHKSFVPKCGKLLKDYVNGTVNSQEISPLLANEPTLVQQCRNRGFMIIQVGDQLRTVYCNGGDVDKGFTCPNCNTEFCVKHMEEHLEGRMIDPSTFQIPMTAYGSSNPPVYDGAVTKPADLRAQYAMDDVDKDNVVVAPQQVRAYNEMLQARKASMSLKKSFRKQTEHDVQTGQIIRLPPEQRAVFEVNSYFKEYGAAASVADISTEFASRGIDPEFQEKLERYAHQYENEVGRLLDDLVAAGQIEKCPCGGYKPANQSE